MKDEIRNLLDRSYKVNGGERGQLIGTERWVPMFGDQSLEMFIGDIQEWYDDDVSALEGEIKTLEQTISELRQELELTSR